MVVHQYSTTGDIAEFRGHDDLAARPHDGGTNVGDAERAASLIGGLALLGYGLSRRSVPGLLLGAVGAALAYRGASGRCPAYEAMGINTAQGRTRPRDFYQRGIHVEEAITIGMPRDEVYRFWRRFENLPKFMRHLEAVTEIDENRSRWTAQGPAGRTVEWDATIINEEPGSLIAWRSVEGADVPNAGSVRFLEAPGDRGTEVKVVIDYLPPGGRVGSWIAWAFGEEPSQQVRDDLRRLKQILETGEIPTTQGQPSGAAGEVRRARSAEDPAAAGVSPRGRGDSASDEVLEASVESFPASDAPGWRSNRL